MVSQPMLCNSSYVNNVAGVDVPWVELLWDLHCIPSTYLTLLVREVECRDQLESDLQLIWRVFNRPAKSIAGGLISASIPAIV